MKRFARVFLTLLLAAALCCPAGAAAGAEIVRAFVYEGTLYAYLRMESQPVTRAEAKIGAQTFQASTRLETVRQAGSPVTWLLLVDNSTSMPAFREEAEAFAESLSASCGERTRLILSTFGDAFRVVNEDVPAEDLKEAAANIPMDEKVTRLHTAIDQALDYFEALPREGNELRCLVILSDAVQYDPGGGVPYEELLERVSGSDVMLHSVGLGADRASLERMGRLAEASGGLHQVLGEVSPEEAGAALAEFGDGFFVIGFDLTGCTAPAGKTAVSVTMSAGSELAGRAETEAELPEPEEPPSHQTLPPSSGEEQGVEGGGTAADPPGRSLPAWAIPAAIAALALVCVLVLVLVLLLLLRKNKRRKQPVKSAPVPAQAPVQEQTPAPARGVYMRLVVQEGTLVSGPEELELAEPLFIGSGPGCTILLSGEDGAERHARVYLSEGRVYLEDLQTPGGTMVNGTRLEAARPLRSGDSITIGGVTFRLKF